MKMILILGSICAITAYANAQLITSKSVKNNEILPSYTYFKKSQYRLFYHLIKKDETPESVGSLYGLTANEVMKMNNLKTNETLPVGQELLLEDRKIKRFTAQQANNRNNTVIPQTRTLKVPQSKEEVVTLIDSDFGNKDIKILQIEGTKVAKPSLVHFIETDDIETYKKQAAQEGKLLFMNFYAHWCVPCNIMQESTFRDQDIAEFMNDNVISIHINGDTEKGKAIRMAYAVNVFPTLLFYNSKGDEITRNEGALGIDAFKTYMKMAFEKSQNRNSRIGMKH